MAMKLTYCDRLQHLQFKLLFHSRQRAIFTARRLAKRGICCHRVSVCLCVCVSVILRYCIKTAERRIMQITPHDRSGTLVYTDERVARSLCHSRASCCCCAEGGRLSDELSYTLKWLGEGSGTTYELIIQTPRRRRVAPQVDPPTRSTATAVSNALSVKSMLQHLRAVRAATTLSVELFDVYVTLSPVECGLYTGLVVKFKILLKTLWFV